MASQSPTVNFTATEAGSSPPPSIENRFTFFTHTLCPYAERVFITLLEKEAPFDLVHIDLSSKPSWYRSLNPAGLVPAVRYNKTTYTESLDIMQWLDDTLHTSNDLSGRQAKNSGSKNSTSPQQLKAAIQVGSRVTSAGLDLLSGKDARYWGIGKGQSQSQLTTFDSALQALFSINSGSKNNKNKANLVDTAYILGDDITLADIAVYPFINRYAMILPDLCGYDVHAMLGGKVGEWLTTMQGRTSCSISSPDSALFNRAARKHASLDFFDYSTYGMFDLHPHDEKYLV